MGKKTKSKKKSGKENKKKSRLDASDDDFINDVKRTSEEASQEELDSVRGKRQTPLVFEEDDVTWFKPTSGKEKNRIDIIPFKVSQDWYKDLRIPVGCWEDSSDYNTLPTKREIGQLSYVLLIPIHYDVGIKGEVKLCLREAFGEKCVICDEMFDKIADDKEKHKAVIGRLRPKWRGFYNVINLRDKDKGIQLWEISFHCFEKYLRAEVKSSDEGVAAFPSLKDGKILVFKGRKKKIGTRSFIEVGSIEFDDRKKAYKTSILDEVFALDEMLVVPSYEEVRSAFFEAEEGEGEEEEEEERDKDDELPKHKDKDDDDNGDGDGDETTEEDINDMDKEDLIEFIEDEDLDIDDPEDMKLSKLRKAVIKEHFEEEKTDDKDDNNGDGDGDDETTEEDINDMDKEDLIEFIEDEDLDIDDPEDMKLSKLRKAVIKEHFEEED